MDSEAGRLGGVDPEGPGDGAGVGDDSRPVDLPNVQGVQIGEHNIQVNLFPDAASATLDALYQALVEEAERMAPRRSWSGGDVADGAVQERGPVFAVPPCRSGDVPRPGLIGRLLSALELTGRPGGGDAVIGVGPNGVSDDVPGTGGVAPVVGMTTGLAGAGGFGKTTLARMLVHDPRVQALFSDGIVWVTLGDQLTTTELADRVDDACAAVSGVKPPHTDPLLAGAALGQALGQRRMLLVVDDAWTAQQVQPWLSGGPNTVRLITTRLPEVLPEGAARVDVDAMTGDEATRLLTAGLPGLPASLVHQVLVVTGRWPLLLGLVNGAARHDTAAGATPTQAVTEVRDDLVAAGVTALDVTATEDRHRAVAATMRVSLDRLTPDERDRYVELAVFGEDVDIPAPVLARYWQSTGGPLWTPTATRALVRRVSGLSLLATYRRDPPGPRIRLLSTPGES